MWKHKTFHTTFIHRTEENKVRDELVQFMDENELGPDDVKITETYRMNESTGQPCLQITIYWHEGSVQGVRRRPC